jgi:endonuclease YncB( thermonuclease family)
MKWIYVLIVVAIVYTAVLWQEEPYQEYKDCDPICTVKVSRVIDGDTFVTSSGLRVRIAGYDAPELGEVGGYEAKQCLDNNIGGKNVRISLQGRDYYGRQLATVVSHRVTC